MSVQFRLRFTWQKIPFESFSLSEDHSLRVIIKTNNGYFKRTRSLEVNSELEAHGFTVKTVKYFSAQIRPLS